MIYASDVPVELPGANPTARIYGNPKTYQVLHDVNWPLSRIDQAFGDRDTSLFPEDYIHVADVQANGLRQVVELTTDRRELGEPWEQNAGVRAIGQAINRDTDVGDVIADPQGQAYRVGDGTFRPIQESRPIPVDAEMERLLSEMEAGWPKQDAAPAPSEASASYDRQLEQAAMRAANDNDRGRGVPDR